MEQIEPGILIENSFRGVTVGALIFPHGTVMIDAPLRMEDGRKWHSILLNQRRGSNRLLVLLDAHPDRTLGARSMECTILTHIKTAEVFRNRPMIFKGIENDSGAVWETYNEAIGMRWSVPDITITDQMSLHWGGPEVILEYHPGPSSGTIWVILPDLNIIFVGDTVVENQPVFLADADLQTWLESLDILKTKYKDYRIVCGRGGVTDVKEVQKLIRYINKINRGLERIGGDEDGLEKIGKLVGPLLKDFNYPTELQSLYEQRLRYGLYQYYLNHYVISNDKKVDPIEVVSD